MGVAGKVLGSCDPGRAHAGAAGRTCGPTGFPGWGSSWKTAACGKGSLWRGFGRAVSHGRDPILEKYEEKEMAPWATQREEVDKLGMVLSL